MLARRFLSIAILGTALTVPACGGGGGAATPGPVDPESAVHQFMNAVRGNSLRAMGELWGSRRGPAAEFMDAGELEQRLTVMRIYLEHAAYEVLPDQESAGSGAPERVLRVRLTRRGCTPVVPFTLVRYGQRWLISEIDLAAAGNPARSCVPEQ